MKKLDKSSALMFLEERFTKEEILGGLGKMHEDVVVTVLMFALTEGLSRTKLRAFMDQPVQAAKPKPEKPKVAPKKTGWSRKARPIVDQNGRVYPSAYAAVAALGIQNQKSSIARAIRNGWAVKGYRFAYANEGQKTSKDKTAAKKPTWSQKARAINETHPVSGKLSFD